MELDPRVRWVFDNVLKLKKESNLPFSFQNCNIIIIREDPPILYQVMHGHPLMAAQHSTMWAEKGWLVQVSNPSPLIHTLNEFR